MAVPLICRERVVGIAKLADFAFPEYMEEYAHTLGPLLVPAALAVQTAILHEQSERERRRNEELAAEAERRASELLATITSMAEGVIVYDNVGNVARSNPAAQRLFGYSAEDLQKPWAERVIKWRVETPDGKPVPLEQLPSARALRGETVRGMVAIIHRSDDSVAWASVGAAPIRGHNGELLGGVSVFSDITELHDLQEQREDFIRILSHDLRNPIQVVQGNAELLLRELGKPEFADRGRRRAEAIIDGARTMDTIIQDLVDQVRIASGDVRIDRWPLPLEGFVSNLLLRAQPSIDVGRVKAEIPANLPPTRANDVRLEQILLNLVTNALKYSPPDTPITITANEIGGLVEVSVADCGPGIAPEDLPHVFDRFYRAKGARKTDGLGLGLFIAKMLVEAHGGHIWVDSEVDRGSTFRFTMPLA